MRKLVPEIIDWGFWYMILDITDEDVKKIHTCQTCGVINLEIEQKTLKNLKISIYSE